MKNLYVFLCVLGMGCVTNTQPLIPSDSAMSYTEAQEFCDSMDANLVEINSNEEYQAVYDLFLAAGEVEGVWTSNRLSTVSGNYIFVMLRGGALIPQPTENTHKALAVCEL